MGGGQTDEVKIINIEYSQDNYNATVTLNKEVTMDDAVNHLKVFVSDFGNVITHHYILDYSGYYAGQMIISDSITDATSGYPYKITLNNNQLIIEDTTGNHGPKLNTICWL